MGNNDLACSLDSGYHHLSDISLTLILGPFGGIASFNNGSAGWHGKLKVEFSKTRDIDLGQNYYDLSKGTDTTKGELNIKYDKLFCRFLGVSSSAVCQ